MENILLNLKGITYYIKKILKEITFWKDLKRNNKFRDLKQTQIPISLQPNGVIFYI